MTNKKKDYKLTPLWQEIAEIIKNPDFQRSTVEPNGDFILYKKIITFLYRGPAGTLYEIKQALGKEQLDIFLKYVDFYLSNSETPGHYYPSRLVKNQIKEIEKSKNLFNLNETLNEISQLEYEKQGDKKAKGWKFDES